MKKIIGATFIIMLLIGGTISANGGVEGVLKNFNIIIDGQKHESKNTPVLIDGSTYLPLRELSEALGVQVGYDHDTGTITLNSAVEVEGKKYKAGTYMVGKEIEAGTYKSVGDISYWARLANFKGDIDSIISNGLPMNSQTYVTIEETDKAFQIQGEGYFVKVKE